MSRAAVEWVKATKMPELEGRRGAKQVLLLLADFRNEETKECFPAIETIALAAGVSTRMITKDLELLEEAGYMTRRARRDGNRQASSQYNLHLPDNVLQKEAEFALKKCKYRKWQASQKEPQCRLSMNHSSYKPKGTQDWGSSPDVLEEP